jgi:hypothetical protein
MEKPELMREFETLVDDFMQKRRWGLIEISFSAGVPALIRTEETKKLQNAQEQNRAPRNRY